MAIQNIRIFCGFYGIIRISRRIRRILRKIPIFYSFAGRELLSLIDFSDKSQGDFAYFAMILLPNAFIASFVACCSALKTLSALHSSIGTICVIMSLCNMSPF